MSVIAASRSIRSRGIPPASPLRRFAHENGLSLVLVFLFIACWVLQIVFGLKTYNEEQRDHHQPQIRLGQYLRSGHFIEATAENWESEFLQMAAFVWLTSFLFQKGSPESHDPYEEEPESPLTDESPWPARRDGWIKTLYSYSLSLTLLALFFISWFLHALGGAWVYSDEQLEHGGQAVSVLGYIATSQFWFESMQNWQSEFLSIFAMLFLAIYLRHKGSKESKPVNASNESND